MFEFQEEYKLRLSKNRYALKIAYQRLRSAIENNNDDEVYAATGELLMWVIATDEWHKEHGCDDYVERRDKSEDGVLLKGLLHAYNMMKHNMRFIQIHHKEGGFSFPITFPFSIPPVTVHWRLAGEVLNGKYDKQKQNYIKHIEGKEIIETFNTALTFLNYESSKFYFDE